MEKLTATQFKELTKMIERKKQENEKYVDNLSDTWNEKEKEMMKAMLESLRIDIYCEIIEKWL